MRVGHDCTAELLTTALSKLYLQYTLHIPITSKYLNHKDQNMYEYVPDSKSVFDLGYIGLIVLVGGLRLLHVIVSFQSNDTAITHINHINVSDVCNKWNLLWSLIYAVVEVLRSFT